MGSTAIENEAPATPLGALELRGPSDMSQGEALWAFLSHWPPCPWWTGYNLGEAVSCGLGCPKRGPAASQEGLWALPRDSE